MPTIFVYWYEGRDSEQKQRIATRITDALVEESNAKRESILIIFQEISPDDTARAGYLQSLPQPSEQPSSDPTAEQ